MNNLDSRERLVTKLESDTILTIFEVGNEDNSCSIEFCRTLRIPDDGQTYPLPPWLDRFPLCKVKDYWNKVPKEWKNTGGFFFPMHQREAM